MTLNSIAERYRLHIRRDDCNDQIIPGRNGHLYMDDEKICACFTDDGRKKPFPSVRFRNAKLKQIPNISLLQDGEFEFTGSIPESSISAALKVLKIYPMRVDAGESRGFGAPRPESI